MASGKPGPAASFCRPGADRSPWLQEVPEVAVEVREDGDRPVRFVLRRPDEGHAPGRVGVIVAPEIIGVEEESNSPAGLIADPRLLLGCRRAGEEEAAFRAAGRG